MKGQQGDAVCTGWCLHGHVSQRSEPREGPARGWARVWGADPGFSRPQSVSEAGAEGTVSSPSPPPRGPVICSWRAVRLSQGQDEPRTRANWSAGPGAGFGAAWVRLSPASGSGHPRRGHPSGEWRLGATSGCACHLLAGGGGLWPPPLALLLWRRMAATLLGSQQGACVIWATSAQRFSFRWKTMRC